MLIDWDVPVTVDDGTTLRADVFRPGDGAAHPAILSYGVYGKGLAFADGYPDHWRVLCERYPDAVAGSSGAYANWEVVDPERFVPAGYACVRVDARGAGRSPGVLEPWSPREALDVYACIEWAATQPWCSGAIGMCGISYYAMNQWRAAALRPPHLRAICVWEGAADFYRDACYHGGIRCVNRRNWFERQVKPVQHGRGERGPRSAASGELVCGPETLADEELAASRSDVYAEICAHPLDDGWHRDRSAPLERIEVPLLSAGAWGGQAMHLRGNVEGFLGAGCEHKWLELHGGEHWTGFYTAAAVELQTRFFDHFLKGEANGWRERPRVLLKLQRGDGGFVERDEGEWPLARTRFTQLPLDAASLRLGAEPASASEVAFAALGEGVEFAADPVERETEFTGPAALRLVVSSSTSDADLFVTLRVYDRGGEEVVFRGSNDPASALGKGWLRASHRRLDPARSLPHRPYHTHDRVEPLAPGTPVELEIEIWPLSVILPLGYRLGLRVGGRDFERVQGSRLANFAVELRGSGPYLHDDPLDRPAQTFAGQTTIHSGPGARSFLLLPLIPAD